MGQPLQKYGGISLTIQGYLQRNAGLPFENTGLSFQKYRDIALETRGIIPPSSPVDSSQLIDPHLAITPLGYKLPALFVASYTLCLIISPRHRGAQGRDYVSLSVLCLSIFRVLFLPILISVHTSVYSNLAFCLSEFRFLYFPTLLSVPPRFNLCSSVSRFLSSPIFLSVPLFCVFVCCSFCYIYSVYLLFSFICQFVLPICCQFSLVCIVVRCTFASAFARGASVCTLISCF